MEKIEVNARREVRIPPLPEKLVKQFERELRIVVDPLPGIWPLEARLIQNGLLNELIMDKEFMQNFDIAIIAK
jgi:hypothetical protein